MTKSPVFICEDESEVQAPGCHPSQLPVFRLHDTLLGSPTHGLVPCLRSGPCPHCLPSLATSSDGPALSCPLLAPHLPWFLDHLTDLQATSIYLLRDIPLWHAPRYASPRQVPRVFHVLESGGCLESMRSKTKTLTGFRPGSTVMIDSKK